MSAAILAALVLAADARVSWRWGAANRLRQTLEAAGGSVAYRAPVTVNGGQGDLLVLGFDEPLARLAARLRRLLATADEPPAGATLFATTAREDGRVLRLVLTQLAPGRTTLFAVAQAADDAARTDARTPAAAVADLPLYAGSQPEFVCADDARHTTLAVLAAPAPPAAAGAAIVDGMRAAGWADAAPAAANGLRIFVKDADVCLLFVAARPDGGGARITVLHKRAAIRY